MSATMRIRLIVLASLTAGLATTATAQTSRNDLLTVETTKAPPSGRLRSVLTSAFLEASTKDAKAVASTGFEIEGAPLGLALKLAAEAPLGKNDNEVDLVDIEGLGDGTEVEVSLNGSWWRTPAKRPSEIVAWCNRYKAGLSDVADCTRLRSHQIPDSLYRHFLDAAGWSEPIVFDVGWTVARAKTTYLEESTLKSGSLDRLAQSVGADVGIFLTGVGPFRSALLAGGYHYEIDYRKAGATQICTPLGTAGALRCRSAVIGRPKRQEGAVVNAEARAFFNPRWAINPQYVVRLDDDEWTLEMPIYFVPDAKGTLIGGMAPKYASESKNWEIRVFIGKAFGL